MRHQGSQWGRSVLLLHGHLLFFVIILLLWHLLPFRSPNWWGRWQIWGPARGKTRRSWRPSRGPSASTRWELAMAMLRRYYQLLRIRTIISWWSASPFQAGRLQYTCKYTTDDLKKTLAQVLPRSKFRKSNLSQPDIASFIYVDRSLFTD